MIRKPTVSDQHMIQRCINILPDCREHSKDMMKVESLDIETDKVLEVYTFQKKATQTVLPDVFNYSWECIRIKNCNYLKVVR